jgi:imidazolonepropionase-like amidohydrolase
VLTKITNCSVLDLTADRARLVADQEITVEHGVIRDVASRNDRHGDRTRVIDVGGRVVMPGLIDGHVHVTAWSTDLGSIAEQPLSYSTIRSSETLRDMLLRGFTTVRDVGGADWGLARAVEEGRIPGPRLIFGGKALSQTGGHGDGRPRGRTVGLPRCCGSLSTLTDGVDEMLRTAREEIRRGAHHIKIMLGGGVASPTDKISDLQYSPEEISAAVRVATNAGKYVAGHAYTTEAVRQGLQCGVRSIEHGNLMDESVLRLFHDHDAYYVPTLVTYHAMARHGQQIGLTPELLAKNKIVVERGLQTLEAADRAGVKIVYGSDLLGELQVHQGEEFRIRALVQSAESIIRSATTVAAELIGRPGELGVIAPGAMADLIVLDGDPLADIGVLADPARNLRMIVKGGEIVRSDL